MIAFIIGLPFLGAFLTWIIGRRGERKGDLLLVIFSCLVFALTIALFFGSETRFDIDGVLFLGLHFQVDGFRKVYALITALMWAGTSLFSLEYFAKEREHILRYEFFVLLTLGATEGVMLSADLYTTFVFFEILSFTSFTWVIHEQTKEAVRAGYTYLFIAVIGGLVLLMGVLLLMYSAGTLRYEELLARVLTEPRSSRGIYAAGICILFGFGAKAGMFPVHVWLPKAHPVAPSPASALLSGILTKVGIYGILMISLTALFRNRSFGLLVLVLGLITMVLGAVLAIFSVNLKRTLACSSMSQIGFILTGIAMYLLLTSYNSKEAAVTALPGLMLHMVNHSLIKLALFMAAGCVVMRVHKLDLNSIRGYGRRKTLLKISFALGALGISGVPLFNGYLSKTLLHESIVEGIHECAELSGLLSAAEWIFLISGGITFAYMLKLFISVFVERNRDAELQSAYDADRSGMNALSTAVIFGSSLLCVLLGQPAVTLQLAALMTGEEEILRFAAFSAENLKGGAISLGIGAILYLVLVRRVLLRGGRYLDLWPKKLDLENLIYRPVLTRILPAALGRVAAIFGENKVLTPLSKAVLYAGIFIGRVLVTSLDALIVFLHGTVFKERRIRGIEEEHPGLIRTLREEVAIGAEPLSKNLSFALMMTCIGILLVLGTLVMLMIGK